MFQLGGLGEVGRNMAIIELNGKLLVIDCGLLFPDETQPGVDLILPDFEPIRHRLADIQAIVLTHGHEDHMGAIPYLLREAPDIPIYSSKLALALLAPKLKEYRVIAPLITVSDREIVQIGDFQIQFLAVTHSIPDAFALVIKTVAGTILHTGDFKIDPLPLDGRKTDLEMFSMVGSEGVDVLMVDSTNAEIPGFVPPERDIGLVLNRVIGAAPGRVIVASFASHVHRIQQIINAAKLNNRVVAMVGRSMVKNQTIAAELGYLKVPGGTLIAAEKVDELPANRVVIISTGSQGEPMSALSRMANGDHNFALGPSDTVVLATSLIPGNETTVNHLINRIIRQGATVIHKGNANVHVSGHAAAGELLQLFSAVKPKYVMPVHGERRHQVANAKLAQLSGIAIKNIVVADNGDVIELTKDELKIVDCFGVGLVFVDGSSVGEVAETSLKDRRILGEEGFISVFLAVDLVKGKVVAGPEVHARGFAEDDAVFEDVIPQIVSAVEAALVSGKQDERTLSQIVRRTTGKWVAAQHSRRPMIVPVVVEA
ncbi:MAG: ribonuclease J [Actinobacteria bacterium]|nr:ribonuclease J [Actinomycetota bacterium]